jgi:hypothetical protein
LTKVRRDSGRGSAGVNCAPAVKWTAGEPRKGVARMGRWIGSIVLAAAMASSWGCAHGPRRFAKIDSQAPLVRARAVGLGDRKPDSQVLPVLVNRLADSDPVVRLAAHEELRKRTGQDFGYLPWASPEERSSAIERWRAWMSQGNRGNGITASPQLAATRPRKRRVQTIKASLASDP